MLEHSGIMRSGYLHLQVDETNTQDVPETMFFRPSHIALLHLLKVSALRVAFGAGNLAKCFFSATDILVRGYLLVSLLCSHNSQ